MEDKMVKVLVIADDKESLINILKQERLDISQGTLAYNKDWTFTVEAYMSSIDTNNIRSKGIQKKKLEDITQYNRERQNEVSQGNRFKDSREIPHGLGKKEWGKNYGLS